MDAGTYQIAIKEYATNETILNFDFECFENAVNTLVVSGLKNETQRKYELGYKELDDVVQQPSKLQHALRN